MAGRCESTPIVCNDSNVCTDDTCNPATGCVFTNDNTNTCTDGSACTTDACVAGRCESTPIVCNDSNVCTDDTCNPATGCVFTNDDTNACTDGSACTSDACVAGRCESTPIVCNDSNVCTDDTCNPATGCVFTNDNTNACTDGSACTSDACVAGRCESTPIVCDDSNVCTDDRCDPATGCVFTPDDTNTCSDGSACTNDACVNGRCQSTLVDCDDASKCTNDSCDPATGCVHTPVVCDDANACTTDACDPASGCSYRAVDCNDDDACTNDSCNRATGCVYEPVECDDRNACTVDACNPKKGCSYRRLDCDDRDACTTDTCNPTSGCAYAPVGCSDGNPCTDDSCDSATGCVYAPDDTNTCTDSNACTADACVGGTCSGTTIVCDDRNPCTDDRCDPASGCVYTANDTNSCTDGNACTSDACVSGLCRTTVLDCNDSNKCTNDSCDPATGCVYVPVTCQDNNACTTDACDPAGGCTYTTITCSDGDLCTNDSCNATTGCVFSPVTCNDGNACTTDACDPATGCTHTTIECYDANKCTNDSCNPASGCAFIPVVCNDDSACTTDSCDPTSGCRFDAIRCVDDNPCTDDSCSAATGCVYTPDNTNLCTDGNACTADACVVGQCVSSPVTCDDSNPCTDDTCNPVTGCLFTPDSTNTCTDGNACTIDACVAGRCVGAPVVCNDNNPCTDDSCDPATGCAYRTDDTNSCTDGNSCTTDACAAGGCVGTPVVCNDNNPCTDDSCNPATGCSYTPNDTNSCTDGNSCTTDACAAGRCVSAPAGCDDNNPCTDDACDPATGCTNTPDDTNACTDNNACTMDACVDGRCSSRPIKCDDSNPCTDDSCDPTRGCVYTPDDKNVCTDGNACTTDACVAGRCTASPIKCDDNNPCTDDSCDPTRGCVYTPDNTNACSDGNACTTDACVAGRCTGSPIKCEDNNPCTDDSCDPVRGCVYTPDDTNPCTDGNACTVDSCVAGRCATMPIKCDDGNPCTDDVCDPARGCVYSPDGDQCATVDGDDETPVGSLSVTVDAAGDVTVVYDQSRNLNDNSYGTNIVNWPRDHKFRDLVGSDKAQFIFKDASGRVVLDFLMDYISQKSGTPSGYASLGAAGGEGRVSAGQLSWLLDWDTSLDASLNDTGYCSGGSCMVSGVDLLVNSPPTNPPNTSYNVGAAFSRWNFTNSYRVKVSRQAFGAAGFGSVEIGEVHNSPPKVGSNAVDPHPCTQCCGGVIGDFVWLDENANGMQDAGEPGIDGVTIKLQDASGAIVGTMMTGADASGRHGFYRFAGLCAGAYSVVAMTPDGHTPTSPCSTSQTGGSDSNCSPASVTLTADNDVNLTIDFGYISGGGGDCPADGDQCATVDGDDETPVGSLSVTVDAAGDVTVVYDQSRNLNDNSYGTNIVNWPRDHKFRDLVGSDKAQFIFKDASGRVVFDFLMDYISQKSGTPSGYASLGAAGGEGRVSAGQLSWLLDWDTSLDASLNDTGYCSGGSCMVSGVDLLVNSPPTNPPNTSYNVGAAFSRWNFTNSYRVKVSRQAFGAAGFGSVEIGEVHNSPPKVGSNAVDPHPCTQCCGGVIGDFVWLDENSNGMQDAGEPGIDGVTIKLQDASGAIVGTMMTGADASGRHGFYRFAGLCAGAYSVVAMTPDGHTPTSPCSTSQTGGSDSNCSPASVTLTADNDVNLTIDFGYVSGGGGDCPADGDQCATVDGDDETPVGSLSVTVDAAGDVTVVYDQSRNLNDNSYGTNIVNWPRDHKFRDLVGSDKAQFIFKDASGRVVLDFLMDYISQKSGTPSGYASLGAAGGEGRVSAGQLSWLLDWDTSLDASLNDTGYCSGGSCMVSGVDLLVNSPPTNPPNTSYNVGAAFSRWNFTNSYRVKVSRQAFGAAGFGSVEIGEVHNSPPKIGSNAVDPHPCPQTQCCRGVIGDTVWLDENANGMQDAGEPGIDRVTIKLLDASGAIVGTMMTGADASGRHGVYRFAGLCSGAYSVVAMTPDWHTSTSPCSTSQTGGSDSNCSPAKLNLATDDDVNLTIDFGYVASAGGGQGCSHGFWKQSHHYGAWTAPYSPDTLFSHVFENAFPGKTLVQVLSLGGGGLNSLGRETVAALLNAASGPLNYDLSVAEVIAAFNNVYPGGNYEALKKLFEGFNTQDCSIDDSSIPGEVPAIAAPSTSSSAVSFATRPR